MILNHSRQYNIDAILSIKDILINGFDYFRQTTIGDFYNKSTLFLFLCVWVCACNVCLYKTIIKHFNSFNKNKILKHEVL